MDILEAIRAFQTPWSIPSSSLLSPQERPAYEADFLRRLEAEEVCGRYEAYVPFTAQEGHAIALAAIELFDRGVESRFEYVPHIALENLAQAVPGALHGLYPRLIERDLFWWHGAMYREADQKTRDLLLARLETTPQDEVAYHDLLCALAWIGDATVWELFSTLKHAPAPWTSVSSVREYATFAGWELTEDDKRRNLCFEGCYDLISASATPASMMRGPAAAVAPHDDRCPWCARSFIPLLDLHLHDHRLAFLPVQGEKLRIPICLNCSFQAAVFFDIESDGTAHWCESNGDPPPLLRFLEDDLLPPWPQLPYVLGKKRKTRYLERGSHLGGYPAWVQYPEYPQCPTCQQTMLFVGQLEPSEDSGAFPFVEGAAYAFLCPLCRKVTAAYQQT
jgi:hypothetical protein